MAAILSVKGRAVFSISPDATVYEAITQLAERNIGALLVLEGDRLVGIFSERDYTRNLALKGRASKYTPVFDVMSTEVVTVAPQATLAACMETMTARRVRHLAVLENGRVVGVISIGDLVGFIIATQREAIEYLEGYIAGSYPR
ncbi:MAG: CBS domain-containing protein [Vicinamibacterales bacterium]